MAFFLNEKSSINLFYFGKQLNNIVFFAAHKKMDMIIHQTIYIYLDAAVNQHKGKMIQKKTPADIVSE